MVQPSTEIMPVIKKKKKKKKRKKKERKNMSEAEEGGCIWDGGGWNVCVFCVHQPPCIQVNHGSCRVMNEMKL